MTRARATAYRPPTAYRLTRHPELGTFDTASGAVLAGIVAGLTADALGWEAVAGAEGEPDSTPGERKKSPGGNGDAE